MGHWLQHFFGFYNGAGNGSHYLFFSGPGSDLEEVALLGAVLTFLIGAWRHVNCHQPGCPRIGRYHVAGGRFRVCAHHHPDGKPQGHHIIAAHRAHAEALRSPEPVPAAPADGDLGRKLDTLHADMTDLAVSIRAALLVQHQGRRP